METLAYILSITTLIISVFISAKSYSLKWTIIITLWNAGWYFVMLYIWEWHALIVWITSISAMLYSGAYLYLKYKQPAMFRAIKEMNQLINNKSNQ